MAARYPPRSARASAPALLPWRVHLPFQPSYLALPGLALPSVGTTGRRHGPGTRKLDRRHARGATHYIWACLIEGDMYLVINAVALLAAAWLVPGIHLGAAGPRSR